VAGELDRFLALVRVDRLFTERVLAVATSTFLAPPPGTSSTSTFSVGSPGTPRADSHCARGGGQVSRRLSVAHERVIPASSM